MSAVGSRSSVQNRKVLRGKNKNLTPAQKLAKHIVEDDKKQFGGRLSSETRKELEEFMADTKTSIKARFANAIEKSKLSEEMKTIVIRCLSDNRLTEDYAEIPLYQRSVSEMLVDIDPEDLNAFREKWPGIAEGNIEGVIQFLESEGIDPSNFKEYFEGGVYDWELGLASSSTAREFQENLCKVCAVVSILECDEKQEFVSKVGFGDQWACLEGAISTMELAMEARGSYLSRIGGQYLTEEGIKCFMKESFARSNGQHARGVLKADMGDQGVTRRDNNVIYTIELMDFRKRKEVLDAYPKHVTDKMYSDMCDIVKMVQNSVDESGVCDAQLLQVVSMHPLVRELGLSSHIWVDYVDDTLVSFQLKDGAREEFISAVENYARDLGLKLPRHKLSDRPLEKKPVWIKQAVG